MRASQSAQTAGLPIGPAMLSTAGCFRRARDVERKAEVLDRVDARQEEQAQRAGRARWCLAKCFSHRRRQIARDIDAGARPDHRRNCLRLFRSGGMESRPPAAAQATQQGQM